jgi:hypothetical protein
MAADEIVLQVGDSKPPVKHAVAFPTLVREFCDQNNFSSELRAAADLARKHFRVRTVDFEIGTDHETGDRYAIIIVAPAGSREEVLDSYAEYTKELVKTVRLPQRSFLRLSYRLS